MGRELPPFDRAEFIALFAKRLRQWRTARGLSQVALAHQAGYAPQTISNLERGLWAPSLTTALILAELLEVHPKLLLFGDEEETNA
jgi:putative transcriptional regulator